MVARLGGAGCGQRSAVVAWARWCGAAVGAEVVARCGHGGRSAVAQRGGGTRSEKRGGVIRMKKKKNGTTVLKRGVLLDLRPDVAGQVTRCWNSASDACLESSRT